jgi:hypothetical protein
LSNTFFKKFLAIAYAMANGGQKSDSSPTYSLWSLQWGLPAKDDEGKTEKICIAFSKKDMI